jgi:hypothetical protein
VLTFIWRKVNVPWKFWNWEREAETESHRLPKYSMYTMYCILEHQLRKLRRCGIEMKTYSSIFRTTGLMTGTGTVSIHLLSSVSFEHFCSTIATLLQHNMMGIEFYSIATQHHWHASGISLWSIPRICSLVMDSLDRDPGCLEPPEGWRGRTLASSVQWTA